MKKQLFLIPTLLILFSFLALASDTVTIGQLIFSADQVYAGESTFVGIDYSVAPIYNITHVVLRYDGALVQDWNSTVLYDFANTTESAVVITGGQTSFIVNVTLTKNGTTYYDDATITYNTNPDWVSNILKVMYWLLVSIAVASLFIFFITNKEKITTDKIAGIVIISIIILALAGGLYRILFA